MTIEIGRFIDTSFFEGTQAKSPSALFLNIEQQLFVINGCLFSILPHS